MKSIAVRWTCRLQEIFMPGCLLPDCTFEGRNNQYSNAQLMCSVSMLFPNEDHFARFRSLEPTDCPLTIHRLLLGSACPLSLCLTQLRIILSGNSAQTLRPTPASCAWVIHVRGGEKNNGSKTEEPIKVASMERSRVCEGFLSVQVSATGVSICEGCQGDRSHYWVGAYGYLEF